MVNRVQRAVRALLDRDLPDRTFVRTSDGREYVRILQVDEVATGDLPVDDRYRDDAEIEVRRNAALSLADSDVHGFLLITLRPPGANGLPAELTAQIQPEWRPYVCALLGRIIRELTSRDTLLRSSRGRSRT